MYRRRVCYFCGRAKRAVQKRKPFYLPKVSKRAFDINFTQGLKFISLVISAKVSSF